MSTLTRSAGRLRQAHTTNLLKFLVAGIALSTAWFAFISYLNGATTTDGGGMNPLEWMELGVFAGGYLSAIFTSFAVYEFSFPDYTHDIFHKFGKAAAMFMAVNIPFSTIFTVYYAQQGLPAGFKQIAMNGIAYWVLATIFLPGAYIGVLVAVRWCE